MHICHVHGENMKYFCKTCDVPVCGDCIVGMHKDSNRHDVVAMSDVTEGRKQKSAAEVRKLKDVVQPRLERAIAGVDDVSEQLSAQARTARSEIRSTTQRVVQTVEAYGEQLVQEVEDEEAARHKVLDLQRDELKSQLESVKNAVAFSDLLEANEAEDCEKLAMLVALEQRAKALNGRTDIADQPRQNANIRFRTGHEDAALLKVKEAVGKVHTYTGRAEAQRCSLDRQTAALQKGETAMFVLQVADCQGISLSEGGDNIIAKCMMASSSATSVRVAVKDKQDGRYEITAQPEEEGDYWLEISVNGERLQTDATFTYRLLPFDPAECHPKITLSPDKTTATHTGQQSGHATVLGNIGMRRGRHSWRCKIGSNPNHYSLGVITQENNGPGDTRTKSQSVRSYRVFTDTTGGAACASSLEVLEGNDTVQLELDCDARTLRITNLCSRNTTIITNLPDDKYFAYVYMHSPTNSVQISL